MPETAEVKEFALEPKAERNVVKPASQSLAEARRKVMPGKRKVTVWLSDEHYARVEKAAALDDRDPATWLSRHLRGCLDGHPGLEFKDKP
jgi:hypothetical protein